MPHPLNDPTEFGSLVDLHGISRKEGVRSLKNHIVHHYWNSILHDTVLRRHRAVHQ